jgi:DNA-binding GntR family transcriptional regulator
MGGKHLETPARSRFTYLHHEIRKRICLLHYKPGEKLYVEVLAKEFDVGLSPVRRVLSRLEADGLVEIIHGVGIIVVDLDDQQLKDTYALRVHLLGMFGEMAVSSIPSDLIVRFEELEKEIRTEKHEMTAEDFSRLNMIFVDMTLDLIQNSAYRYILERLYYQSSGFFMLSIHAINLREEFDIFHREIKDVLSALKQGDLNVLGHIRKNHVSLSYYRMSIAQKRNIGVASV